MLYYGSGTVAHTVNQWRHTRRAESFLLDDVIAAILKVWRHIRITTRCV